MVYASMEHEHACLRQMHLSMGHMHVTLSQMQESKHMNALLRQKHVSFGIYICFSEHNFACGMYKCIYGTHECGYGLVD